MFELYISDNFECDYEVYSTLEIAMNNSSRDNANALRDTVFCERREVSGPFVMIYMPSTVIVYCLNKDLLEDLALMCHKFHTEAKVPNMVALKNALVILAQ